MAGGGYPQQSGTYAEAVKYARSVRRPSSDFGYGGNPPVPLSQLTGLPTPKYDPLSPSELAKYKESLNDPSKRGFRPKKEMPDFNKGGLVNDLLNHKMDPSVKKARLALNLMGNAANHYDDLGLAADILSSLWQSFNAPAVYGNMGSWKRDPDLGKCGTAPSGALHLQGSGAQALTGCLAGQAIEIAKHFALGSPVAANINLLKMTAGLTEVQAGQWRATLVASFSRTTTTATTQPTYLHSKGAVLPGPAASPLFQVYPFLAPIMQSMGTPHPLPFALRTGTRPQTNSWAEGHASGYAGPAPVGMTVIGVNPLPVAGAQPNPGPGSAPSPSTAPNPGTQVDIAPPGTITPTPVATAHKHWPTAMRTKEKKLNLSAGKGLGMAINIVTEGYDFLGAFHKALPKAAQAKRQPRVDPFTGEGYSVHPGPFQQAEAVWKNFDQISWPKAIANLLKNQVTDRAVGKWGSAMGKANKKHGDRGMRSNYGFGPAL